MNMSTSFDDTAASSDVDDVPLAVIIAECSSELRRVSCSPGVKLFLLSKRTGAPQSRMYPLFYVHRRSNSSSDSWLDERVPHLLVRSFYFVHIILLLPCLNSRFFSFATLSRTFFSLRSNDGAFGFRRCFSLVCTNPPK